jgi:hypothetical protein
VLLQLFHRIAEADSAQARKLALEGPLSSQVQLRNVAFPEAAAALAAHGGLQTPALWDGQRLYTGLGDVAARLLELEGGG